MPKLRVGTAGWAIPAAYRERFGEGASVLARYAGGLDAVEINSSFYRSHRRATYERWAASVGPDFRFSVKAPRSMTHERRLVGCREEAERFADEIGGLGGALGAVLVQLPPSLAFDAATALPFLERIAGRVGAPVVCEPRHRSWFTPEVDRHFCELGVARVAADPAVTQEAGVPGGSGEMVYFRLHGSPEIYASAYGAARVEAFGQRLVAHAAAGAAVWCIFDNTMHGHATDDALHLAGLLTSGAR